MQSNLFEILENINDRINDIELYLKVLDSAILKLTSVIEILNDKNIISKDEVIKKSNELVKMYSKLKEEIDLLRVFDSNDIGHA